MGRYPFGAYVSIAQGILHGLLSHPSMKLQVRPSIYPFSAAAPQAFTDRLNATPASGSEVTARMVGSGCDFGLSLGNIGGYIWIIMEKKMVTIN